MIEYSSKTISRLTGLSLRTLQWWSEKGVVRPRIHGHDRRYSELERYEICILAELKRRGIRGHGSIPKLRRVLRAVRRRAAGRRFLLTDGRRSEFVATLPEVLGRFAESKNGLCLVDLAEVGAAGVIA